MENNLEDKIWCVYIHRNKINNKAYIGITSKQPEERWGVDGHNYPSKSQPVIYNAIQKYGWDNFEHIIFIDNIDEYKAKHIEKLLIALYKTNCTKYNNPNYGYNMTDGGDGTRGRVCTEETKKKISEANSNPSEETRQKLREAAQNRSEETCQKISEAAKERLSSPKNHPMYGKNHTEKTKEKIGEKAQKRLAIPENNPMYGKKHTAESKKKIGDGHRNPSEKTRKKMSDSAKKRCTEEWKQKMSEFVSKNNTAENNPNAKNVYQYSPEWELVRVWKTGKAVAEEFNVSTSTVSGTWLKNSGRLYRGFHWSLLGHIVDNTHRNEAI